MIKKILIRFAAAKFAVHCDRARTALEINNLALFSYHRDRAQVWHDRALRWGDIPESKEQ